MAWFVQDILYTSATNLQLYIQREQIGSCIKYGNQNPNLFFFVLFGTYQSASLQNLVRQLEVLEVPILSELPQDFEDRFSLIVDAIFGFSFSGDVRPPFDTILQKLANSKLPIVSIDIPSGWDVELGDNKGIGLKPDMLSTCCF